MQYRGWISGMRRWAVNALALAVLLVPVQAQTFTTLHSFAGGTDGRQPKAGLVQDATGVFYGTTFLGGAKGRGTGQGAIFQIDSKGDESVIYGFAPGGYEPMATVLQDGQGNLYGTTYLGGHWHFGMVYKFTPSGLVVLHSFKDGRDGKYPASDMVTDGVNYYGTTTAGGATTICPKGCGTVFKINSLGKYSVIHRFKGSDGGPLVGSLLWSNGFLYGVTGATLFRMDITGEERILYRSQTLNPLSGLIQDAAGNLYGTGEYGAFRCGFVYKLNLQGQLTDLYDFAGSPDGCFSKGGLVQDTAGNLYGTTQLGGLYDAGTVFKLDTTNQLTVLYSFTGGTDGAYPKTPVTLDQSGTIYGTEESGGVGFGTVFKVTP
jgi:uncharacterized repeat protein (TIGR03803 family)